MLRDWAWVRGLQWHMRPALWIVLHNPKNTEYLMLLTDVPTSSILWEVLF